MRFVSPAGIFDKACTICFSADPDIFRLPSGGIGNVTAFAPMTATRIMLHRIKMAVDLDGNRFMAL